MKRFILLFIAFLFISVSAQKNTNSLQNFQYLIKIELQEPEDIYKLAKLQVPILEDQYTYVFAKANAVQLSMLQKESWGIKILDMHRKEKFYYIAEGEDITSFDKTGEMVFFEGEITLFSMNENNLKYYNSTGMRIWKLRNEPIKLPGIVERKQISLQTDPFIEAMVASVTAEDVEEVLRTLVGFKSRHSTHSGCQKAVEYVHDLFIEWGLDSVHFENYKSGYAPNVIGIIKGEENTDSIYLIGAHIDATSNQAPNIAPGADDNGSGSTVTIIAAKAMSKFKFRHDVRFVLFTGEENGIVGSGDYADRHSNDNIRGVLINDMVGWTNDEDEDYQVEANTSSEWLGEILVEAADTYVGLLSKIDPPSS